MNQRERRRHRREAGAQHRRPTPRRLRSLRATSAAGRSERVDRRSQLQLFLLGPLSCAAAASPQKPPSGVPGRGGGTWARHRAPSSRARAASRSRCAAANSSAQPQSPRAARERASARASLRRKRPRTASRSLRMQFSTAASRAAARSGTDNPEVPSAMPAARDESDHDADSAARQPKNDEIIAKVERAARAPRPTCSSRRRRHHFQPLQDLGRLARDRARLLQAVAAARQWFGKRPTRVRAIVASSLAFPSRS